MEKVINGEQGNIPKQAVQTVLLSDNRHWKGITVTEQILPPMQTGFQHVADHLLMVVTGQSGVGEWRGDSDKWNCKYYSTGSMSIVPHGHLNDARWDKQARAIYIKLSPERLQQIFHLDGFALTEVRAANDSFIRTMAHALCQEVSSQQYAGVLYGETLTISLATYLVANYSASTPHLYAPPGKLSALQLWRIIEYIHAYTDTTISIDVLASLANLSPFHFVRVFKNSLGISPHQYVLRLKIDKAKQLIKRRKHTFTEIAYLLGFADGAHFANVFKKVTGLSPSQFTTR